MKKKFKDIIEYAAVIISDESISWIESKPAGTVLPDASGEPDSKAQKLKTASDLLAEKAKLLMLDAVSRMMDKATEKLQEPAEKQ